MYIYLSSKFKNLTHHRDIYHEKLLMIFCNNINKTSNAFNYEKSRI